MFVTGRSRAVAALIAIAAISPTSSAWAATPSNGVYGGVVNGTTSVADQCGNRHNEGEGYFRVKTTANGRKVVPPGNFKLCGGPGYLAQIVAPNGGTVGGAPYPACDPYNANLAVASIPIKQGAFDWSGYTAKASSSQPHYNVRFKGTWSSASVVKGFTRITKGTCDTGKMYWTMRIEATS
jgi:hypothetical protein